MDTKIRDKYFVLTETQYESVKAVTVHNKVVGYLDWIKQPSDADFTSQMLKVIAAYENAVDGREFFKGCKDYSNWGNGWEWIETYVKGLSCPLVNVQSAVSWHTGQSKVAKFPIKREGLHLGECFRNYAPADRAYYFSVE